MMPCAWHGSQARVQACCCWVSLTGPACPDITSVSLTRHATQARELQAARAQLALKQSLVAEKDTIIASLQQRTGQVLPAWNHTQMICLLSNTPRPFLDLDAGLPGSSAWPLCCMTYHLARMRWASSNISIIFKASGSVHVDADVHVPFTPAAGQLASSWHHMLLCGAAQIWHRHARSPSAGEHESCNTSLWCSEAGRYAICGGRT